MQYRQINLWNTTDIQFAPDTNDKLTKSKGGLPNDNILLKIFYTAIQNATKIMDYAGPKLESDIIVVIQLLRRLLISAVLDLKQYINSIYLSIDTKF